jgi:hypothetical protein
MCQLESGGNSMNTRKYILGSTLAAGLVATGFVIGQAPTPNVEARRHPNLAAAQRACDSAYQSLVAAQHANEFDMQGHAQKAEEMLQEASQEIKQAALNANRK